MIVRLNGGLGNQMFQYAFGASVSRARVEGVVFHKVGLDSGNHRAYGLGVFNAPVFQVQFPPDWSAPAPVYQEKTFAYDAGVFAAPMGSYFIGNWQTEKYFDKELVRASLTPKNFLSQGTVISKMKIIGKPSCSIHVRRTDYLNVQHYHGLMGMEYYNAAIEYVKSQIPSVHFFVFSDDPAWCNANFQKDGFSVIAVNGMGDGTRGPSTEHEDLYLMGLCEHAIIPNSSFGWWGAWFGDQNRLMDNRIVVAPKQWFNPTGEAKHLDTSDICPSRWTRI